MKRFQALLFVLCFVLVFSSCSSGTDPVTDNSPAAVITAAPSEIPTQEPEDAPEITEGPAVIETRNNSALHWIGNHPDAARVILTKEQIGAENKRIFDASPSLVDMSSFPETLSGSELRAMIEDASMPSLPKYTDGGTEITQAVVDKIAQNRNLSAIPDSVSARMGVVTKRANIRHIPSDMPFYSAPDSPYDRIQETEIGLGQLVVVLHESTDGKFLYIQSGYYKGWVDKSYVALTESREEWLFFEKSEYFVIVTEAVLEVGDVSYDLGARIPLISVSDGQYKISVPKRNSDGKLETMEADIDSEKVSVGYVPFTYENYVALAFKYQGYRYSWGGLDDSVDCSSFAMNVLRCFGLIIPRDTGTQNKVVGSHTDVSSLSEAEKASMLKAVTLPTFVYISGHVRLYLGYENDSFYFIESSVDVSGVNIYVPESLEKVLYIDIIGE